MVYGTCDGDNQEIRGGAIVTEEYIHKKDLGWESSKGYKKKKTRQKPRKANRSKWVLRISLKDKQQIVNKFF